MTRLQIAFLQRCRIADVRFSTNKLSDFVDESASSLHFVAMERARELSLDLAESLVEETTWLRLSPEIKRFALIAIAQFKYPSVLESTRQILLHTAAYKGSETELHLFGEAISSKLLFDREKSKVVFVKSRVSIKEMLYQLSFCSVALSLMKFNVFPIFVSSTRSTLRTILMSERLDVSLDATERNRLFWATECREDDYRVACQLSKNLSSFQNLAVSGSNQEVLRVTWRFRGFKQGRISREHIHISNVISSVKSYVFKSKMIEFVSLINYLMKFSLMIENCYEITQRLNVWCYVYDDASLEAHAFDFLAMLTPLKTVKIQYSNIPFRSLLMLSSPTAMFVFSCKFEEKFSDDRRNIKPGNSIAIGYPLHADIHVLQSKSDFYRTSLKEMGAKFVIGFFDESVQTDYDLWSFKTETEYKHDVEELCKFVIDNPDVGVLFKTQFVNNSPVQYLDSIPLLAEALGTGRILFPVSGRHRNLILPGVISLASDLCIGELLGATASLEGALLGTYSIFVDGMKIGEQYRNSYYREKIVHPSLGEALRYSLLVKNSPDRSHLIEAWRRILVDHGLGSAPTYPDTFHNYLVDYLKST